MQRNIASVTTGMTSRVASDSPVIDTESRTPANPRELRNLYDSPTLSIYFQESKGFAVREQPSTVMAKNTRFSEKPEVNIVKNIKKHLAIEGEVTARELKESKLRELIKAAMGDVEFEPNSELHSLALENRDLFLSDKKRLRLDLPYRGRGEQKDGHPATMEEALGKVHRHMVAHWPWLDEGERHAPPPGGWKIRNAPTPKVEAHPADKNPAPAPVKSDIFPDWPDWR
ncbi:hypothetical protein [Variovorax saccharolyticus]|uniref:hypothetical protein n=1 Tax=Variovorax saccharolyticus TaxID=3053516 RepID=UPI002575129D|nr:hypothetical protein [Variovorax sp. J31P216]MDM0029166.1 hypothetical protein [Variovorax sp. J31P216]